VNEAARIVVKPAPGITEEQAYDARARAWSFVFACFDRHLREKGGTVTAPDARKEINGSGKEIIPQQST